MSWLAAGQRLGKPRIASKYLERRACDCDRLRSRLLAATLLAVAIDGDGDEDDVGDGEDGCGEGAAESGHVTAEWFWVTNRWVRQHKWTFSSKNQISRAVKMDI